MALFTRLNGHTSVRGPMYFVFWLDRCLYISDFQSHQVKANSEVGRSCMSLTMTDTEVSTKLLTIFEALISSCSQQYQLLCEEDQLKANKIFKKTFSNGNFQEKSKNICFKKNCFNKFLFSEDHTRQQMSTLYSTPLAQNRIARQ